MLLILNLEGASCLPRYRMYPRLPREPENECRRQVQVTEGTDDGLRLTRRRIKAAASRCILHFWAPGAAQSIVRVPVDTGVDGDRAQIQSNPSHTRTVPAVSHFDRQLDRAC